MFVLNENFLQNWKSYSYKSTAGIRTKYLIKRRITRAVSLQTHLSSQVHCSHSLLSTTEPTLYICSRYWINNNSFFSPFSNYLACNVLLFCPYVAQSHSLLKREEYSSVLWEFFQLIIGCRTNEFHDPTHVIMVPKQGIKQLLSSDHRRGAGLNIAHLVLYALPHSWHLLI